MAWTRCPSNLSVELNRACQGRCKMRFTLLLCLLLPCGELAARGNALVFFGLHFLSAKAETPAVYPGGWQFLSSAFSDAVLHSAGWAPVFTPQTQSSVTTRLCLSVPHCFLLCTRRARIPCGSFCILRGLLLRKCFEGMSSVPWRDLGLNRALSYRGCPCF